MRNRQNGPVLRWLTAGESHGPALVAVLEGLPANCRITRDDIARELERRRAGYGRGARMSFEQDEVEVLGGVRHGLTIGSPVAIRIGNTEWPKWETVMSPDPVDPAQLDGLGRAAALTRPRPGHADLVGMLDGVGVNFAFLDRLFDVGLAVEGNDFYLACFAGLFQSRHPDPLRLQPAFAVGHKRFAIGQHLLKQPAGMGHHVGTIT